MTHDPIFIIYRYQFIPLVELYLGEENRAKSIGPKRNNESDYETRSNRELMALCNEPSIGATFKSHRIRWTGLVWRAESQLILTVTKWKTYKSQPRGRPRTRWEDLVKKTSER